MSPCFEYIIVYISGTKIFRALIKPDSAKPTLKSHYCLRKHYDKDYHSNGILLLLCTDIAAEVTADDDIRAVNIEYLAR